MLSPDTYLLFCALHSLRISASSISSSTLGGTSRERRTSIFDVEAKLNFQSMVER